VTKLDSVFFKETTKDKVSFKIGAEGAQWREVTLPLEEVNQRIKDGTLWSRLEELALEVPLTKPESSPEQFKCPVCNSYKSTFLRGYKVWWFCGFCGAHLTLDKANNRLIVRRKR
jgi:hypothetical protein